MGTNEIIHLVQFKDGSLIADADADCQRHRLGKQTPARASHKTFVLCSLWSDMTYSLDTWFFVPLRSVTSLPHFLDNSCLIPADPA